MLHRELAVIHRAIFFIIAIALHSQALRLQLSSSPITLGRPFNLTWILEEKDPSMIAIVSNNTVMKRPYTLANSVKATDGNVSIRIMPSTPGTRFELYDIKAVDASNFNHVLSVIPSFNISTSPVHPVSDDKKKSNSTGAIIGGTFGGVILFVLILFGYVYSRRRRHRRHGRLTRPSKSGERLPPQTPEEWQAQITCAMVEARRQSEKVRLSSKINRSTLSNDAVSIRSEGTTVARTRRYEEILNEIRSALDAEPVIRAI